MVRAPTLVDLVLQQLGKERADDKVKQAVEHCEDRVLRVLEGVHANNCRLKGKVDLTSFIVSSDGKISIDSTQPCSPRDIDQVRIIDRGCVTVIFDGILLGLLNKIHNRKLERSQLPADVYTELEHFC